MNMFPLRRILREYMNPGRRRSPTSLDRGSIAADGMAQVALDLWLARLPRPEVVRRLTKAASNAGVLDQVHMIRHGIDLDGPHLIPEGATNRQIIEMIELAG